MRTYISFQPVLDFKPQAPTLSEPRPASRICSFFLACSMSTRTSQHTVCDHGTVLSLRFTDSQVVNLAEGANLDQDTFSSEPECHSHL